MRRDFSAPTDTPRDSGSGQKSLAFAAVMLFARAVGRAGVDDVGPARHERRGGGTELAARARVAQPSRGRTRSSRCRDWCAIRLPASRSRHLSAVVFLFDRMGTFITSSRANVDFLKLGAGDESPFVVSLDAPATVARYRVSFRTDDGIVPHIDRRGATPAAGRGEQPVNVSFEVRQSRRRNVRSQHHALASRPDTAARSPRSLLRSPTSLVARRTRAASSSRAASS